MARALVDAFEDLRRDDLTVWVNDLYIDLARFPVSRFPWAYAVLTRRYPRLWRLVFRSTNRPPGRLELLGDPIGGPRLGRLLAKRRPDTVVSVLPGVNGFIARSLARHELHSNFEVVVTDWADIHLSWAADGVTHYIVPTVAAAEVCRAVGFPSSALSVLGFPVRRQFARVRPSPEARLAARERFGIPAERFVFLAMTGTEGSAGALAHLRALVQTRLDAEVIVVSGRNRRLQQSIGVLDGANPVRALGFVEEIADLMLAADVLVTKPGGVTLAEAFCCHLPVLLFDPLPGQEEGNARYVVAQGAAELARSPRHLAKLAAELRWAPAHRARLAAGGAALARPTAAADAVAEIIRRAATPAAPLRLSPSPEITPR